MHDLLLALRGRLHLRRAILVAQHQLDLAAQHLLIELERRFAIAVEKQVGIDLHRLLLGD
jgi:hypothetical protein